MTQNVRILHDVMLVSLAAVSQYSLHFNIIDGNKFKYTHEGCIMEELCLYKM
jgi:bacterioferritin (cytochrome b1)